VPVLPTRLVRQTGMGQAVWDSRRINRWPLRRLRHGHRTRAPSPAGLSWIRPGPRNVRNCRAQWVSMVCRQEVACGPGATVIGQRHGCGGACPEGWCGVHLSDGCFVGSGAGW